MYIYIYVCIHIGPSFNWVVGARNLKHRALGPSDMNSALFYKPCRKVKISTSGKGTDSSKEGSGGGRCSALPGSRGGASGGAQCYRSTQS